ncbi:MULTISPECIES: 2-keto-3-deoxygluconate permease [unclassified Paenibacillus]|uniref:2-keto-3-deoxygluconate permease n=1 Tax=unclassified Paenibacillus TaxID=185978 RepID=UPI001AE278B2|nr:MULTISPECIES: 2-keto-3-deoxygluconate permease [unclassified Paenibacillus]MBP1155533.1 2-keto-3-deoxygluconate permease [Paenibacillus sp. PvP091]MBP1169081.1 2-keto-3-deoxygluconate permease [Paenibacillus sp. PvR098]MBP2440109.1 2-keto-3-deoxygluconate permease [Paenibacillus sp. PvP052]
MQIKKTIEKVPGGLMVVPLLFGALLNTIDQMHIPFIMNGLKALGVAPNAEGFYEFMRIGGFSEALFKTGALTLIALFLFCAGSQMNLRVGGRSLKKGIILTLVKYAVGVAVGFALGSMFDPMSGLLGLSTVAIIGAMTNGNGGMYVALTGQYGNRSDVGAVSVLSLNDGPFFTLMALGLMGANFPVIAFVAVLLPIAIGMILGNLDPDIREFLKPGETLPVPFFAFALGAGMNLSSFFNPEVVGAGLLLGIMTTLLTGAAMVLALKLSREKSTISGWAEASTAGNAAGTPAAIAAAAAVSASTGAMSAEMAKAYADLVPIATAQISIATLSTALMCPLAVILWDKYQKSKGIDGRLDEV